MDDQQGTLTASRCRALLSASGVGRLVFTRHALPAVVVARYRVVGSLLLVDAAEGSGWPDRVAGTVVAFETDEADAAHRIGWSVVVTGQPARNGTGVELDLDRCVLTGSELAQVG